MAVDRSTATCLYRRPVGPRRIRLDCRYRLSRLGMMLCSARSLRPEPLFLG